MSAPALPKRTCAGCCYLRSFTPRPDEQRRYSFGELGYGCKEPGFEGYVQPDRPQCLRGPFLRESPSTQGANNVK